MQAGSIARRELLRLGLFASGCVLYGISSGVQMIQRGFAYLAESAREESPPKKPRVTPLPPATGKAADAPATRKETDAPTGPQAPAPAETQASPMQRSIGELRDIFALYQQGALTQEEFEGMKQYLLASIKAAKPQGH